MGFPSSADRPRHARGVPDDRPISYFCGCDCARSRRKQGSATTSGVIVGVGYLGGILAGDSIARLSIAYGWRGAFTTLALGVWLSSIVAFFYRRHSLMKVVSDHRITATLEGEGRF